jgi:FtsP/CotA-like multicopper oxidase with cupredoxin domain
VGSRCENKISPKANFIYLVTTDTTHNRLPLNYTKEKNNFGKLPSDVNTIYGVEYYDLRQINQSCSSLAVQPTNPTMCVKLNRMRPFFFDGGSRFNFNGHYHFSESGHSDNPQIGTTEDWFLINTIFFTHPIHVHLINYQIIAQSTLKNFQAVDPKTNQTYSCSLYEIDFYKNVSLINKTEQNLTKLCIASKQIKFDNETSNAILSKANLENTVNVDDSSVSGLDVRKTFNPNNATENAYYNGPLTKCDPTTTNVSGNYKYLCGPMDPNAVPEYEKRWKEVAHVDPFLVRQVRIRWTKTDYDPSKGDTYPYFSVPEDELLEYPGYVYHCHILRHEDKELMRSFMMQPSDQFAANYQPTGQLK